MVILKIENKCWQINKKLDPYTWLVGTEEWYSHHGKQLGISSKNCPELLHDPAIPFPGV
jgi:hypothetical protein